MSPADLNLRPFELEDLQLVDPWLQQAGIGVPRGTSHKVWGDRVRSDPRIVCRVATRGAAVSGLFRLDVAPDRMGELTVLVAPGLRSRGLGRAIVEAAMAEAACRGLRHVVALVRAENTGAVRFFSKIGFIESEPRVRDHVHFHHPVG